MVPSVTITQTEYENLLHATQEYFNLRQALLSGGVDSETLETLTRKPEPDSQNTQKPSGSDRVPSRPSDLFGHTPIPTLANDGKHTFSEEHHSMLNSASASSSDSSSTLGFDHEARANGDSHSQSGQQHEKGTDENQSRGVTLKGISERTTLHDVAGVIRGGPILNMYLRPGNRSAHIIFVDPQDAQKFYKHFRKHDIYILGKRIEISMEPNPYYITNHVAHKVAQGATRNICIVSAKSDVTETAVRQDLEHIYRLEIVDVVSHSGDVYVSLNAVHHALTAKNCLSSRLRYKGTKIEFYDDECAQDLPKPTFNRKPTGPLIPPKKNNSMVNRFEMLFGDDSGSSDEEPEQMRTYVSREQGIGWAGNAILA